MPIFEYVCDDCGHGFEALVRSADAPSCPQCGSSHLEKQLSVFATAGASADAPMAGPCGTCGHPDGPGSCAFR